jgi:hypothetical protein
MYFITLKPVQIERRRKDSGEESTLGNAPHYWSSVNAPDERKENEFISQRVVSRNPLRWITLYSKEDKNLNELDFMSINIYLPNFTFA